MQQEPSVVRAPNNTPYIVAVVLMAALGITGVVLVALLYRDMDRVVVMGLIGGFVAPTTLSLLAFMKSQETHLSVNSRLDAFMANAVKAAHAEGQSEGRKEGRDAANARTDQLAENPRKDST